jgi:ribosomal protein S18 acetylase RimI-like enzyme
MFLDLAYYEPQPHRRDIIRVETAEQITAFAEITANNWDPPDVQVVEFYRRVSDSLLTGKTRIDLYLCYQEGRPVAAIELCPTDAVVAGIYSLSTLADFRRRGIGTSMVTFALNRLKTLCYAGVVLAASSDALGLYQQLGFRKVTTYHEFNL